MRVVTTTIFLIALLGHGAAIKQCRNNINAATTAAPVVNAIAKSPLKAITLTLAQQASTSPNLVNTMMCYVHQSQRALKKNEACEGITTGNMMSNDERKLTTDSIDEYRAMLANGCKLPLGAVQQAGNMRRVKWSCDLELAAKFSCSSANRATWKSDETTFRGLATTYTGAPENHAVLWSRLTPFVSSLLVNPSNETIGNTGFAAFMKFFMSDGVSQVGCYAQSCSGYDYLACKTDLSASTPITAPLYTPKQRCETDSDCTVTGWPYCNTDFGMCDSETPAERALEKRTNVCKDALGYYMRYDPQDCGSYATGSSIGNDERDIMVRGANYYRAFLNNNCPLALGVPKQITNYRKVKYSCELENQAVFSCANANYKNWKSDATTLRQVEKAKDSYSRRNIFLYNGLWKNTIRIMPDQSLDPRINALQQAQLRVMMDPNVTQFGCFIKVCGAYEFMACKTGQPVVVPPTKRLYTPGTRCNSDSDCTLPGYGTCDTVYGLCEES